MISHFKEIDVSNFTHDYLTEVCVSPFDPTQKIAIMKVIVIYGGNNFDKEDNNDIWFQ